MRRIPNPTRGHQALDDLVCYVDLDLVIFVMMLLTAMIGAPLGLRLGYMMSETMFRLTYAPSESGPFWLGSAED